MKAPLLDSEAAVSESEHPDFAEESAYIAHAYERLDRSRESAESVTSNVESRAGGTHQARYERDVLAEKVRTRLEDLDIGDQSLIFGRIDQTTGDAFRIGRVAVFDEERNPMVVDWRAPIAEPFYRATGRQTMGLTRRRHYITRFRDLLGIEDEYFTGEGEASTGLKGERTLVAALEAGRTGRLGDIVGTIQGEQDEIIRAPLPGAVIVQGGPGTGKTVVALHRAAYLLYNQRAALAESGVLVVGPTNEFLNYISGVLPSLGETGVVSVTATELYPGIRMGRVDSAETAELKGQVVMADFLATAVALRQRRPTSGLAAWYGAAKVTLNAEQVVEMFDTAQRHRTHNDGSVAFRTAIIDALSAAGYDPSFGDLEEARSAFESSADVDAFMLKHWPTLTPEQALNDTLGSPAIMRMAGEKVGLTPQQLQLLARDRDKERALSRRRWSDADVPLLDELLAIVGGALGGDIDSDRTIERDEADEFELATAYDESDDADDFLDDESEQDHDDLWSLDELVAEEQRDHDRLDQRRRAGG